MKVSEAAIRYATLGYRVLPVRRDKSPATAHGVKDATASIEVVTSWRGLFDSENGGVGIACGGPSGLLVVDCDKKKGLDGLEEIERYGQLPDGPRVRTPSGGTHIYLRVSSFDAPKIRNFVGILPGVDIKWDGGYVVAPPTPGYIWLVDYENPLDDDAEPPEAPAWLIQLIEKKRGAPTTEEAPAAGYFFKEGQRNMTLTRIAGYLRRQGLDLATMTKTLMAINRAQCQPPLPDKEVEAIAKSINRYPPGTSPGDLSLLTRDEEWPVMDPRAFHGYIGEVAQAIAKHSEADPVALLLTGLCCAGSLLGRGPFFPIEGDRHYANIFVCLVGETSKGRKGTSWGRISSLFREVDPTWPKRVASGLSSGEGLIYAVRDPLEGQFFNKKTGKLETTMTDKGVDDKRLLCYVPEFGGVLKILRREGNTLSATLRCAWDSGDLRILTKNAPIKATQTHISLLAHVTMDEVRKHLDETEIANGLGNRFLWALVRRSQFLPFSQNSLPYDYITKLQVIVDKWAQRPYELRMTSDAADLWSEMYPIISQGFPGLAGALAARSEAHTIRLAIIYAIFSGNEIITYDDLVAALCVVDYCRQSVSYIWQTSVGDVKADMIYSALLSANEGLTLTELHQIFARNIHSSEMQAKLGMLKRLGMADVAFDPKYKGNGRPPIKWIAIRAGAKLARVVPP